MNKESLRKKLVLAFVVIGILLGIYEANKPGPLVVEGTSTGYNGDLTVKLQVKPKGEGFKIIGFDVIHQDTPPIADPAIDVVKTYILKNQNTEFDVVSGATYTSEGVREATKNAIEKIK
ncbi:FMN-binding protein [Cetobacterium somerae]|uniref:FMN-binding protein n=1 Tax=Cetobacterium sp. NK01 TaxID=2993530 RepID=UPI002115EBD4|nr:FMN-binding protein [Cetobacterium sp. NK01]MCQ8212265.1 FMN-binding protein [Cetobacterium sp. NK01]